MLGGGKVSNNLTSETDVELKVGINGIDVKIGIHSLKRFLKVKKGGVEIVSLPGGKFTLIVRRLENDIVRYAVLDNYNGAAAQMGEL